MTTIFSQKTIFPTMITTIRSYSVCEGSASTTNKEGTHKFLKVPQSKFWCPGCAPAAEKFWRRHCVIESRINISEGIYEIAKQKLIQLSKNMCHVHPKSD